MRRNFFVSVERQRTPRRVYGRAASAAFSSFLRRPASSADRPAVRLRLDRRRRHLRRRSEGVFLDGGRGQSFGQPEDGSQLINQAGFSIGSPEDRCCPPWTAEAVTDTSVPASAALAGAAAAATEGRPPALLGGPRLADAVNSLEPEEDDKVIGR